MQTTVIKHLHAGFLEVGDMLPAGRVTRIDRREGGGFGPYTLTLTLDDGSTADEAADLARRISPATTEDHGLTLANLHGIPDQAGRSLAELHAKLDRAHELARDLYELDTEPVDTVLYAEMRQTVAACEQVLADLERKADNETIGAAR